MSKIDRNYLHATRAHQTWEPENSYAHWMLKYLFTGGLLEIYDIRSFGLDPDLAAKVTEGLIISAI